ncbi:O-acyltransferase WSD1-like [Olea europaea subsp. europaea]|uniref:O-acyltransferase WSD1-like n=1 Tax=Olea europaea subsp. europaea TaxID=158383 RepID=A0A8S0Q1L7_OLEEU|nr:O-acyltransferase WSD1-like [Olea europaea subsp. europaea]
MIPGQKTDYFLSFMDRDEPLTPAGRLFLQPETSQIINCLIGVKNPIDADAFKAEVKNSVLLKHPRFCSLMVKHSSGREYWRRTEVDVDRHVLVFDKPLSDDPSISDEDSVNDYLADLSVSSPLNTDKPLWEIHLLMAHNCLVFRLHHALGDGISLMSMLLSCCRRADDSSQLPTAGGVGTSSTPRRRRSLWTLMKVVWYTLVYVLEFMLRSLWLKDKKTVVSGGAGVELWPRKLATAKFRLDDMKTIKKATTDATINDVLFGVLSCGFSRYLDIRSPKALGEGLKLTGAAMVNLRPQPGLQDISKLMNNVSGTRWGNKFGMMLLPIYYHKGGSNPLEFLKRAKSMIDKKKLSLEAPCSYKLGHFVMSFFGAKVTFCPTQLNYMFLLLHINLDFWFSWCCSLPAFLITEFFAIQPLLSQT